MTARIAVLAAAVDVLPGPWTTGRAWRLYRQCGLAPMRRTARCDLADLARRGQLVPIVAARATYMRKVVSK